MVSFDLLGVRFTSFLLLGVEMPLVCSPIIRIKMSNAQWRSKLLQLSENRICLRSSDRREDDTALMIDSMPEPALLLFLLNNAPHFIHCSGVTLLDDHMPDVSRFM
jgi:hypothetical protein